MHANGLTGRCADDAHAHKKRADTVALLFATLRHQSIIILAYCAFAHICTSASEAPCLVRYSAISENSAPEAKS